MCCVLALPLLSSSLPRGLLLLSTPSFVFVKAMMVQTTYAPPLSRPVRKQPWQTRYNPQGRACMPLGPATVGGRGHHRELPSDSVRHNPVARNSASASAVKESRRRRCGGQQKGVHGCCSYTSSCSQLLRRAPRNTHVQCPSIFEFFGSNFVPSDPYQALDGKIMSFPKREKMPTIFHLCSSA